MSESRPTKQRRTREEMNGIRGAMYATLAREHPMTDRQLFYRMVSEGVVGKTEAEYKSTVVRLLSAMRRSGVLPYDWLADSTRWMRKPATYSSLEAALKETAQTYRRGLWYDAPAYVEIWLEKDALAGVLFDITAQWDVPLMVTRGYSSLSFLYSAAEAIKARRKPAYLYYLGDHDPSGRDIPRVIEKTLRSMAPGAEIHFQRVAVTEEQIALYRLPTRPTKKKDSRSKRFVGESVEVDALPPSVLRNLVASCIVPHVDREQLARLEVAERSEREVLDLILQAVGNGALGA